MPTRFFRPAISAITSTFRPSKADGVRFADPMNQVTSQPCSTATNFACKPDGRALHIVLTLLLDAVRQNAYLRPPTQSILRDVRKFLRAADQPPAIRSQISDLRPEHPP